MRRWNGWGDDTVDYPLPRRGRSAFWKTLVGPGTPPRDATLAEVAGDGARLAAAGPSAGLGRPEDAAAPRPRPEPARLDRAAQRPRADLPRRRGLSQPADAEVRDLLRYAATPARG